MIGTDATAQLTETKVKRRGVLEIILWVRNSHIIVLNL